MAPSKLSGFTDKYPYDERQTPTPEQIKAARDEIWNSTNDPAMLPDIVEARKRAEDLPKTHLNSTPERKALRDKIVNELYGSRPDDDRGRRLDIVMGYPGSGKSSILVEQLKNYFTSLLIDADDAKMKLPEYDSEDDGLWAEALHVESGIIIEKLFELALMNGDNIVWPTVGGDAGKLRDRIETAKSKHRYEVYLHHLSIPLEEAVRRVVFRYRMTGRFVDPFDYIRNQLGDGTLDKNFDILWHENITNGCSEWEFENGGKPRLQRSKGKHTWPRMKNP